MALSKFKRGGNRNNKSFFEKKSNLLQKHSVLQVLDNACLCEDECMWKLMNKLDNVVETVLEMRRQRFHGAALHAR